MKIERLIGIIMLLLQRELVSASEMATMFEVSKRTIFRDIDTLAMANIPFTRLPEQRVALVLCLPTKSIKSFSQ